MSKKPHAVDDWIQRYLKEEEPRSKSLMISVFGDSIAPYAEGIWLGTFIELMAPLGLNERLVRTSAFRLIEEGWLRARRDGRRSYYTLTATGTRRFETAYSHIYLPPEENWDGMWTMVLLPRNEESPAERIEFKRELEWEGFAPLVPGMLVHPSLAPAEVKTLIDRHGQHEHVAVFRARAAEGLDENVGNGVLSRCWNLADVEALYAQFLSRFGPLLGRLDTVTLTPAQAFLVQTLMIHSFRRASLHDPRLPLPMLPPDWLGQRAYRLCRELYTRTWSPTREHLHSLPGFVVSDARGGRLRMPVGQRFGMQAP